MLGKVKWFRGDRGYGFILGEDQKDYFLHIRELDANLVDVQLNIIDLKANDRVEFTPSVNSKGGVALKVVKN